MRNERMNHAEALQLTLVAVPLLVALLVARAEAGSEIATLVGTLAGLGLGLVLFVARSVNSLTRPMPGRE